MIYFIQGQNTHAIKISLASAPARRLAALQTAASEPLALIATMQGDRGIEKHLHARFRAYHIRGEWFRGEGNLLDAIRKLTGPGWLLGDPLTVSERSERRGGCRYGLGGLRMKHLPTGKEFVCTGTHWGAGTDNLRLREDPEPTSEWRRQEIVRNAARRLGEGTPEFLRAVENFDQFGLINCADITPLQCPEGFNARECILLDEWPANCCPEDGPAQRGG